MLFILSVCFNSQAGISYQNCDIRSERGQVCFLLYIVNVGSQLIVRKKIPEQEKEKEFSEYNSLLAYILGCSQKLDEVLPEGKDLFLDNKKKFIAHYKDIGSSEEEIQLIENTDFKNTFSNIIDTDTFKSHYDDCVRLSVSDRINDYVLSQSSSGSIPAFTPPLDLNSMYSSMGVKLKLR